jgi:hypothetical protein
LSATLRLFLPISHYLIGRKDMKKVILLLALAGSHAVASSISYMGTLDPADANSLAFFSFTLATSGTLNIQTWGYGGGTNAAGTVTTDGGFDPLFRCSLAPVIWPHSSPRMTMASVLPAMGRSLARTQL